MWYFCHMNGYALSLPDDYDYVFAYEKVVTNLDPFLWDVYKEVHQKEDIQRLIMLQNQFFSWNKLEAIALIWLQ